MNRALSVVTLLGLVALGYLDAERDRALRGEIERLTALVAHPTPVMVATAAPVCPPPPPCPRCAAEEAQAAPAQPAVEPAPARPEPSLAERAAIADARRVLDDVVARGRLTRADLALLGEKLRGAPRDATSEQLLQQLAVGINTGRIVPEDPTMPLLP